MKAMNFISASLWPSVVVNHHSPPQSSQSSSVRERAGFTLKEPLAAALEEKKNCEIGNNLQAFSSSPDSSILSSLEEQSSGGGALGNCYPAKRKRMRMSPEQLKVLQKAFLQNPMPSASCRSLLAKRLGMNCRSVQIWFQNRRAKLKQQDRKKDEEGTAESAGESTACEEAFSSPNPSPMPNPSNPKLFPSVTVAASAATQRHRSFSAVGFEGLRFCTPQPLTTSNLDASLIGGGSVGIFPRDEQLYFGNDGIYQQQGLGGSASCSTNENASPFFTRPSCNLDDFCLRSPEAALSDEELVGLLREGKNNFIEQCSRQNFTLPTPVASSCGIYAPSAANDTDYHNHHQEGHVGMSGFSSGIKKRSFSMSCDLLGSLTTLPSEPLLPFPFGGVGGGFLFKNASPPPPTTMTNHFDGVLGSELDSCGVPRVECDIFDFAIASDEHEH